MKPIRGCVLVSILIFVYFHKNSHRVWMYDEAKPQSLVFSIKLAKLAWPSLWNLSSVSLKYVTCDLIEALKGRILQADYNVKSVKMKSANFCNQLRKVWFEMLHGALGSFEIGKWISRLTKNNNHVITYYSFINWPAELTNATIEKDHLLYCSLFATVTLTSQVTIFIRKFDLHQSFQKFWNPKNIRWLWFTDFPKSIQDLFDKQVQFKM